MNRIKNLLAVFAFALLILGVPSFASAQWRDRDDDYYGRNSGRNSGYYNNGYLRSAVQRLKNNSREFSRRLDRELDNSRYDGRNREDYVNQLARDFKDAADRLERRVGNGRNSDNGSYEAQQVLNLGSQLDREISRLRLSYNVQNDWYSIRQDLQAIANAYGYNGGWGRGGNNYPNYPNNRRSNGDWRSRIPFPLPF